MRRFLVICYILIACLITMHAQQLNSRYLNYIDQYKHLAVYEMQRYNIPASITLAQGLLESAAGTGSLVQTSNNHFGIKCGSSWYGPTVSHDDDATGECFRKYSNARESYEDHSLFLRSNQRYTSLFRLSTTDYKGWAYGLKRAGYATSPTYAVNLINLIELYQLYRFDGTVEIPDEQISERVRHQEERLGSDKLTHQLYEANGLLYIVARSGDTFKSLSKELHIRKGRLISYNDLYKDYVIQNGDIIYLDKKNKKAAPGYICHIIKPGDSMFSISQKYGIRLKNLYKMNKTRVPEDGVLVVGEGLRLR